MKVNQNITKKLTKRKRNAMPGIVSIGKIIFNSQITF